MKGSDDGVHYSVESVNLGDHARQLIEAARESGADPLEIADTYWRLGLIIRSILVQEAA